MFGRRVDFKPFSHPPLGLLHPAARPTPSSTSSQSASWPECLGFVIWGSGPTFVIHVEPWSPMAQDIVPGDQIIAVDDIPDVEVMDAAALKAAVARRRSERQTTRGSTPALKVVSRTKEILISPTKKFRYGFTVRGTMPVQVRHSRLFCCCCCCCCFCRCGCCCVCLC